MMKIGIWIAIIYILVVNIIGFAMMGVDKQRAINNKWRISEASLFTAACVGGSIGSICGMQIFRHKTKHWYFVYGMPSILIVQIALVGYIVYRFIF